MEASDMERSHATVFTLLVSDAPVDIIRCIVQDQSNHLVLSASCGHVKKGHAPVANNIDIPAEQFGDLGGEGLHLLYTAPAHQGYEAGILLQIPEAPQGETLPLQTER